jgi:hypothetical protein
MVPALGIWCALAYVAPSPVGLVLPAIPYLALGLAVMAFLLCFGLFRSNAARWTKVFRSTVVSGIIFGLVISGIIAIGGILIFGCPFLPPASAGTSQTAPGWISIGVSPWHQDNSPVLYFYGATWCPYCSASSWPIWKALSGFGTVTGTSLGYSAEDNIPEIVLANAAVTPFSASSSSYVTLTVSEDISGNTGTFPTTSSCYELAYVTAYSGSSIPFVVINGQYVHGGSSLISPSVINSQAGTPNQIFSQVANGNGNAWNNTQSQTWWMMAFIAKSNGATFSNLAQQPYYKKWTQSNGWGSDTQSSVSADLAQIH